VSGRIRPISPPALVDEVADRLAARAPQGRLRVAVDGADAADPDAFADSLVDPLRVRGRPVLRVRSRDFLRPASVRLERGRTNPQAYYERWLDEPGLRREVLDPLGPGGNGRALPSLWDADADRATRAAYTSVPPGGIVLVSGSLLLGAGLPFDVAVHLALSPAALARRTDPDAAWTLPAVARYEAEVRPCEIADVVVRIDDPRHPALAEAG
jgi:hypothetical protein